MHYKLKPSLTAEETERVNAVQQLLNKREVEITKGEYNKHPWPSIFSHIEQFQGIRKLSTYSNQAPIALKCILAPGFPMLKELVLSCNRITSIESMARMIAPLLQDINLHGNRIHSVRALRKAGFPHLQQLNISGNPILDPSPLFELPTKELKELHIQRYGQVILRWPNLPIIGESKQWVLKLQAPSKQLRALSLKSNQRREENLIDRMIEAKYPVFKAN